MARQVVYAITFKKKDTDDPGEEIEQEIPFLKQYTVFCADQCEGCPSTSTSWRACRRRSWNASSRRSGFSATPRPKSATAGTRPITPSRRTYVQLPPFETFRDAESHAATLAHELTHWTRHPSRLEPRRLRPQTMGRRRLRDGRACCRAWLSAFLCADLAITPEVREDHAELHRPLAQGPERRQAGHLHRRQPRQQGGRLPARSATPQSVA